jgi:hypothetical protein
MSEVENETSDQEQVPRLQIGISPIGGQIVFSVSDGQNQVRTALDLQETFQVIGQLQMLTTMALVGQMTTAMQHAAQEEQIRDQISRGVIRPPGYVR